jgi:DNA-directed RNA polymerase
MFESSISIQNVSNVKNSKSIFDMVNGISSIPFKINQELLDFLLVNKHNLLILQPKIDLTKSLLELKKSKVSYRNYCSLKSQYDLQNHILNIALMYKNIPSIYFPVRLDSRGRIYCVTNYLNYQASELAKSLLLFSKSSRLSLSDEIALEYFYNYGANCYGGINKKLSITDKCKWIKNNHSNIINFDNGVLLNNAENKFLFIAFCLEYIKLANTKNSYINTYLPIQLDATCNGYQHLSMLSRDGDLGKDLNLGESSRNDVPKDFYGLLLSRLTEEF